MFESEVAKATGKRFTLGRAPYHDGDLCVLVNAHGPPSVPAKLAWLRSTVSEWVIATDPKFSGGWTPAKLLDWLNSGRPDRRDCLKKASRGRAVQSMEGACFEIPKEF